MKIFKIPYIIFLVILLFGAAVFFFSTREDKKIQEIKTITEKSNTDEEWVQGIVFQGALADMSLHFIEATVLTDVFFTDVANLSNEERVASLDLVIQKWVDANAAIEQFSTVVDSLPDYALTVSYGDAPAFSFIEKASASGLDEAIKKLEDEEKKLEGELKVSEKEKELGRQKILEIVDKAPPGQKLKTAADLFGTDAKTAHEALTKMRALESKIAVGQAGVLDTYSKTAQTIKTAAKVTVFVGGVVAGGGMVTLVGKAAHIVVSSVTGAGLMMEVSETAVKVGIADEDGGVAAIAKAKEAQFFEEMSFVVGITDIAKALGQFGKVVDAAGGLKNFLTADGLKKIAENKQLMTDMRADASGNLQTIVDSGPAAWDFLTKNPEVKTIVLNTATPGKIVLTGTNKTVAVKELPTAKTISDFVKAIYEKAVSEAVVSQEAPSAEEEIPTFTEVPEEIRIDADSSWEGILNPAATLSLRARCAFKTVAGGNYPLEVYVNGQPVATPLLNKKMNFTYKDGRTFSYLGGTSGQTWMLFYIPQMGLNNSSAAGGYQVMTDPGQANNYKWSVSSYLSGASYMKVRLRNNGACLGHQIVIRGLSTQ